MNTLDILYTPLDTPEVPSTDIPKLLNWIKKNSPLQNIENRGDASQNPEVPESKYPWNIIYPKVDNIWQYDFDKEFPVLANFFSAAYGLNAEEVSSVLLLPVKSEFAGTGFWHSDLDNCGLRMYIENQETENFLLIRPTIEPYSTRPAFGVLQDFKKTPLQDKTFSASLRASSQTFFINNVRAVHAVNTINPGTMRIAVIVGIATTPKITAHINDLILRSAEKFKEHAILWPAT
jgi:hypothetical protein